MNAIIENKSFQEKMNDRIRDSIGDLLSDEDLQKLVERGMEEVFFRGRIVMDNYRQIEKPCLIHAMVQEHIKPIVEAEVKVFIDENRELVADVVKQTLEVGAGSMLLKAMDKMFNNSLANYQGMLINDLRNNGVIR